MALSVRGAVCSPAGLRASQSAIERGMSRVSSGLRIQRAADDAAGLAISERLRAHLGGSVMAARNVHDGINVLSTAEGGLASITDMLQRLRDLSLQASSGTTTPHSRGAIAEETAQLVAEIDRTARATSFNGHCLLDGSRAGGFAFQVGASADDQLSVQVADVRSDTLGLRGSTVVTGGTSVTAPTTYLTESAPFGLVDTRGANGGKLSVSVAGVSSGNLYLPAREYHLADHGQLLSDLNSLLVPHGVTATISGGGTASARIRFDAAGGDTVELLFGGKAAGTLGISTTPTLGVTSFTGGTSSTTAALADLVADGSQDAIGCCDAALARVLEVRAGLGAMQNRMEHRLGVLAATEQNLATARSRITDADVAQEWSGVVRAQVLSQTGLAMQSQALAGGQRVLQLLGSR